MLLLERYVQYLNQTLQKATIEPHITSDLNLDTSEIFIDYNRLTFHFLLKRDELKSGLS